MLDLATRPYGTFTLHSFRPAADPTFGSAGPKDSPLENRSGISRHFRRGRTLYGSARWTEARESFERCQALEPNDGPGLAYIERCRYFQKHTPGPDWDGVFTIMTK